MDTQKDGELRYIAVSKRFIAALLGMREINCDPDFTGIFGMF